MPRELGGSLVECDRWESFKLTLGRLPMITGKNCWPLVLHLCWTDSITDSSSKHCCLHCLTYSSKCCVSSASLCRVSSDSKTREVPVFSMIRILLEFIVNLAPANKKFRFVQTIQLDNILSAKHAYLKVKCKNTHNTEKISAKYKLQQSVSSGKKK